MKLTKDEARDAIYGDNEDFEVVMDDIFDTSRWSEHHSVILKHIPSGKFYSTHYSRGLTESQDEVPWEYDEPELTEVVPVEKVVIAYEAVENMQE